MTDRRGEYRRKGIDPSAIIHKGAELGKGVEVGPYTVIESEVKIGAGTKIGSHVQIKNWTRIGENNKIYNGVSMGMPPQHDNYQGEKTYLVIGDNNVFREYVTAHRGTTDGSGETRVGSNNLFMAYSHIAHDCHIGNQVIMANSTNLAGHVVLENQAYLAGLVGVHQFVRIGRLSMVGPHSKVTKDVPPYIEVQGHPATVQGINLVGLRRAGINGELREDIKRAYHILYESGLNTGQATEEMDQKMTKSSEEMEHFIRFLKNSSRGICR